eukprot:449981_1
MVRIRRRSARKSTGGKAPRKQLAMKSARKSMPTFAYAWPEPRAKLTRLQKPAMMQEGKSSKPIYYIQPDTYKEYLIITNTYHIIKYDIENDKYIKFVKFTTDYIIPEYFAHFIDYNSNKLYLISSVVTSCGFIESNNNYDILIVDLQTAECVVLKNVLKRFVSFNILYPQFHFINNTINIIYYNNQRGYHEIFDTKQHEFVESAYDAYDIKATTKCDLFDYYNGMHYPVNCVNIKSLNKLIIIGAGQQSNEIWELDLNCDMLSHHAIHTRRWKLCEDIKCPIEMNLERSAVVLGFDSIIYVLFQDRNNIGIWCLDILDKEWYQSIKRLPLYMKDNEYAWMKSFISTGGRYAYFYKTCIDSCGKEDGFHDKIDLFDLCPERLQEKICEKIKTKDKKMIFGFIRRTAENQLGLNFPDYLKRLVLCYYLILPQ